MKRDRENSTDRNKTRIFRDNKQRIFRKQNIDDDIEDFGASSDLDDTGFEDTMRFDFDESDVEKYRKLSRDQESSRAGRVYRKQNLDTQADPYGVTGRKRTHQSAAGNNDNSRSAARRNTLKDGHSGNPDASGQKRPAVANSEDTVMFGIVNKKQTNKEIRRMSYVMIALMLGVIAYMVYFNLAGSRDVVNNPNNSLLTKLAEKVQRGSILSSDGEVLAQSVQADDGTYYRSYPYSNVFAHVVGTSDINKSGVEQSADYDLVTSDINPVTKILNDIRGIKNPGNNVVTTLNSSLQQTASAQLGDNEGAVIALEPSTGKVLAMVSKPDYDPNTLSSYYDSLINDSTSKVLLNQATQGLFVPGSIFKIVTTMAYLRSGNDPDAYSYYCDGSISLATDEGGTQSISCYNGESHGQVDLTSSFAESCNSSYANIGQSISANEMNSVSKSLLFNTKLPASFSTTESVFSLNDTDSAWTKGATAIGQGNTQISPIHAAMLVSAIANGGELMEPYVIDHIVNAEGDTVRTTSSVSYGDLMSSTEAARLQEMMEAVVQSGTGYNLQGKSYTCAGKTGTAEVSGRGNNAWFVGYAPAEDPQIVVCVLVEDSGTASDTAVPIAGAVFDEYFSN